MNSLAHMTLVESGTLLATLVLGIVLGLLLSRRLGASEIREPGNTSDRS